MKQIVKNIIIGSIAIFTLIFLAVKMFSNYEEPYKTYAVEKTVEYERISTKGIAIREEYVIEGAYGGYLMYLYEDGMKVSNGYPIATIYANANIAGIQSQLDELNAETLMLEEAENPGVTIHANADVISKKIADETKEMILAENADDFVDVEHHKNKILELMCTNNIVLKKETDFSAKISVLKKEAAALSSKIPQTGTELDAPVEGNFLSFTDGFENFISMENALMLTPSQLNTYIENAEEGTEKNTNKVGKIATNYEWYFAVNIDYETSEDFNLGESYKLRFVFDEVEIIPFNVKEIIKDKENGQSTIIFSSTYKSKNTLSMRVKNVDIITGEYTGLKIPKSAIRFYGYDVKDKLTGEIYDGKDMGVYALIGIEAEFRKIDRIYETEDYIISKIRQDPGAYKTYVQPGDFLITGTQISTN